LVAPDYPGFGHSDAPPASSFGYTFDHVAAVIERFVDEVGLTRYALVMQDYGGPVVGDASAFQPQRQRMRFGQPSQRCLVSIDVVVCHRLIIDDGWPTGLSSPLLGSSSTRAARHKPSCRWQWSAVRTDLLPQTTDLLRALESRLAVAL
jgi:pimeloyl-ACP methyl ester carboxylesterase